MNDKKIVIIAPELLPVPPVKGGAVEHWIHKFTEVFDYSESKLTVISRPAYRDSERIEGVEYRSVKWTKLEEKFFKLKSKLSNGNLLRKLCKIQNVWSYGVRAIGMTNSNELLYIHNEPNLLLFVRKGQRVILHMHNDHLSSRLFAPLYKRLLSKVEKVVFVSQYLHNRALEMYPEYQSKFVTVFNATDADFFMPYAADTQEKFKDIAVLDNSKKYILYAGRITPIKGVHILLEAFKTLRKQRNDIKLIICGSSFFADAALTPYQKELYDLSKSIEEDILFTGYIPQEKLRYLYSAADLFVVPSIWQEPQGLVALEAMASGTLLLATDVGGLSELVRNGENGFSVIPNDPNELSLAMDRALNCQTKKEVELLARKDIEENYNWNKLMSKVIELMEKK